MSNADELSGNARDITYANDPVHDVYPLPPSGTPILMKRKSVCHVPMNGCIEVPNKAAHCLGGRGLIVFQIFGGIVGKIMRIPLLIVVVPYALCFFHSTGIHNPSGLAKDPHHQYVKEEEASGQQPLMPRHPPLTRVPLLHDRVHNSVSLAPASAAAATGNAQLRPAR